MSHGPIPTEGQDVTPEIVEDLIATVADGVEVAGVEVRRVWRWGDGEAVSTSGRMDLRVTYAGDPGLPEDLVLKVARADLPAHPLYRNEVAAYRHLAPARVIRAPRCFGARFDESTGTFGLLLEDLAAGGARFSSALSPPTLETLRDGVRSLAAFHAAHWGARADWHGDVLGWAQSHVAGDLHELFGPSDLVPSMIAHEVATVAHKRELVASVGQDAASLRTQVAAVQRHQAELPTTLVHGDCHVGNTYVTADGAMGFLDWQLSVRGHAMHDLSYLITTAIDVADRRAHERDLIALHLEELRRHGVDDVPSLEEAFDEHRRAQAWNTYIGWLTCPVENYGWEINVLNHVRLLTAYRDLDTAAAVAEIA